MTATERLRELLDERGVPWKDYGYENHTWWGEWHAENRPSANGLFLKVEGVVTPEKAIAATLGQVPWVNPTWERWHKSLKHDEIKSIRDAVEQLMYEAIEFGGDMGPNGNTYNGIDEGDVLTGGFINEWIERFAATLESGTCKAIISDNLTESEGTGDAWADCSECGHLLYVLTGPNSEPPNYCPNCGRRCVG